MFHRLLIYRVIIVIIFIGKEKEGRISNATVYKCPKCNQYIQAGSIVVEGKNYHPKCFICMKCNGLCRPEYYQNVNGKFYCQGCVDKTPELYNTLRNQKLAAIEAEKQRKQTIIDEENERIRRQTEAEELKNRPKQPSNNTYETKNGASSSPLGVGGCCIIS